MKILIISGAFFPVRSPRSFRTTELAKEFCLQGHDVTVCIPKTEYDYSLFKSKYPIKIDYIDIVNKPFSGTNLFVRGLNRLRVTYMQYPYIKYLKEIPKYLNRKGMFDAIISIAVPHPIHWGVDRALRNSKKPLSKVWIADCGDPFMLCTTDTFRNPFYFKAFEKSFCRRADYITIPVKDGIKGYYPEFHSKIRIIPQGFDFSEIKTVDEYHKNNVVTFAYAGGFIPGIRDPRPILDYLASIDIDFRFYIYTNQQSLISSYKQKLKDKLIISGYIDRRELIYKMSSYDFLLNLENGTNVQTPSKLVDYSLAKRPVLSIFSQNIDKEKFNEFLAGDYSHQTELPDVENYNIKNVVSLFIKLINEKIN